MARKNQKVEKMETVATKKNDYRENLKAVTNALVETAQAAGRTELKNNQLLRECYNLTDVELNTFDGWKSKGAQVKKGQHAYLFWGAPIEKNGIKFCPVRFLFAKDQVYFNEAVAQ